MKKKQNWFQQQANKEKTKQKDTAKPSFKPLKKLPILDVLHKSKKEEAHFKEAFAFAKKVSDPNSHDMQTIHLNMQDQLVFNMPQDETYQRLWESGQLLLLVEFPKCWETMPLTIDDEWDDEPEEILDDFDRFDYLYETGLKVYNPKV